MRTGKRTGLIVRVAAGAALLLAPLAGYAVAGLELQKSTRALVEQAGALQRDSDIRVVAWQLDHLPSLNFYVQRNVFICEKESEVRTFLSYPLPVYLFLPASEWERLRGTLQVPYRELARRPDIYKHDDVVVVA